MNTLIFQTCFQDACRDVVLLSFDKHRSNRTHINNTCAAHYPQSSSTITDYAFSTYHNCSFSTKFFQQVIFGERITLESACGTLSPIR